MHPSLEKVTADVVKRSSETRAAYLARIGAAVEKARTAPNWLAVT